MSKLIILITGPRHQHILRPLAGGLASWLRLDVKEVITNWENYHIDEDVLNDNTSAVLLSEHVLALPPLFGPDKVSANERICLTEEQHTVHPPITSSGVKALTTVAVIGNDDREREWLLDRVYRILDFNYLAKVVSEPIGNTPFPERSIHQQTIDEVKRNLTVQIVVLETHGRTTLAQLMEHAE